MMIIGLPPLEIIFDNLLGLDYRQETTQVHSAAGRAVC